MRQASCWWASALWFACALTSAGARAQAPARTAQVVMLSDIHFDPYLDPGKFRRLQAAAVSEWSAILAEPETEGRDAAWEALHTACGPRGPDTSFGLLRASLAAAHAEQPTPWFVTVSGDLMAHEFDCRFQHLAPAGTPADYSAFAAKTTAFVAAEVKRVFPGTPIYFALGNNDSGCGDYRESARSAYLKAVADAFADALPSPQDRRLLRASFAEDGGYSVALPAPAQRGRIVVLQDSFEARTHTSCAKQPDAAATVRQVAWLRKQLQAARIRHEHVWVMAHIPPGIDVYSTVHNFLTHPQDLCVTGKPVSFLSSTALVDALVEYGDVVSLSLFAHTHEDEFRLLTRTDEAAATGSTRARPVAAKLVPSISPVNGNHPSFTLAQVRPRDMVMVDYTVVTAQGPMLTPTAWKATYSFRETYKADGFTPQALAAISVAMASHRVGTTFSAEALAYQRWYFPGDNGLHGAALELFWPSYTCALREDRADAFRACACGVPQAGEAAKTP